MRTMAETLKSAVVLNVFGKRQAHFLQCNDVDDRNEGGVSSHSSCCRCLLSLQVEESQQQQQQQPSPCVAVDIARPFSCSICPRRFKLRITQEAHMRAHAGGNPCSCAECGVTFKKQTYLINHVYRVHTTTNEKPIKCTLCSKGFVHANAFKTHMDSHTGERPYRCALCGKSFTQKGTLKRHMVTHTGEKPYNCSVCGKEYSTKQNLKNHMAKYH